MGKTLTGTELIQILSRVKEECTTPIDDTLTIEGNAADAKKTGDEISALNSAIESDLYYHQTNVGDFAWTSKWRVNSTKKAYATNQSLYAGLGNNENPGVSVYPGSTIKVKAGYTMDYTVVAEYNSAPIEGQRGITAGTVITVSHAGLLLLSVTDGTTDVTTAGEAKALAVAGLEIDLVTTPIKNQVTKNKNDIEIINNKFAVHKIHTNEFFWGAEIRVNSIKTAYAINQSTYAGLYKKQTDLVHVYPGSTIEANTGYTMDYALIQNGATKQSQRNVPAGNQITIEYEGELLLSVSDGTTSTSTQSSAANVAKNGLTIDLLVSTLSDQVNKNTNEIEYLKDNGLTKLFSAQRYIARDWHIGFINVSQSMELGSNHIIPGTAKIWSISGNKDLNQKGIWMSDGTHPFKGAGVTDMYVRTISSQLAMIPPSYKNGAGETTPTLWTGRKLLWMGTSIPAGSDPDAGSGIGSTYPTLVASQLGATVTNNARGSSCVRINASTGEYTGMIYSHFLRSLSRTVAECDAIAADWSNIYDKIANAPSTLSAADLATMKAHSFENLLLPWLDGTYTMPDLFVIDHGHNDVRPKGIDGENDLWITPSFQVISKGILADDEYMTENNYSNLKTALNDDLSGITNVDEFAATLNRNCFKGAVNFIITVILKYNPYARIVIVSDYN